MRYALLQALLACLLWGTASAQEVEFLELEEPVNATCPVMPDRAAKGKFTVGYNGREVSLCCRLCTWKFAESPEEYAAALDRMESEALHQPENPAGVAASAPGPIHSSGQVRTQQGPGLAIKKLHPVLLHFPLALLISAFVAEFLGATRWLARAHYASTVRFCLWGGVITAVPTAITGWLAAADCVALSETLEQHRWLGLGSVGLALVATALEWRVPDRTPGASTLLWRVTLLATVVTIGAAGHFGGVLVHGDGLYNSLSE